MQDRVAFDVKILNHQMEDLALSFTINSLSSHVLLLQKNREAESLLGFKDNGIEMSQEKNRKVTVLSYPLKKINFLKTNTRDIKDQYFNLSGHLDVASEQQNCYLFFLKNVN